MSFTNHSQIRLVARAFIATLAVSLAIACTFLARNASALSYSPCTWNNSYSYNVNCHGYPQRNMWKGSSSAGGDVKVGGRWRAFGCNPNAWGSRCPYMD